MSFPRTVSVTLTTNGSGAATGETEAFTGTIHSIRYAKTDFADGVDFVVTTKRAGDALWSELNVNASKVVYPAAAGTKADGTGSTVHERPHVSAHDAVQIAVTNGGATKTGTFYVVYY